MNLYAVPQLTLLLIFFGAAIVVAAQAVGRRFGNAGLLFFWLCTSATLAGLAGAWYNSVMPTSGRDWGSYLIPFLFLLVEIGAVAVYISRSSRGGGRGRRQFFYGLLVFTAALIPAVIVAQIPDMLHFASLSR